MALFQAVAIGLIALIITPGYFFYFDVTPKVLVLLGAAAVLFLLAARSRSSPRGPRLFPVLLLLNAGSLALSTAFSPHRALSLFGSTWRSYGALVQAAAMLFAWLVAWQCAGRPDRVRTILRGIAVAGLVSAAYGIAQYFGWDPFLPAAAYHVGEGAWTIVRPPGTLGYASYFATWLLMTVFLSLALAHMETARAWRLAARLAAALALAAMLLTGTRAALLGLAVGVAVWLLRRGFRLPRGAVAAAVVLVVSSAGFYYSPPGQQLRSRSRWFAEDPWGGARPLLWRDSFLMALKRPVAGYGPEVFFTEFPHFESRALAKAYPDFVHESPHNILLDALVSQGVPGFLLLGGLCAAGFLAAWRVKAGLMAAALAAGVVSQQFTAFTVPTAVIFLTTIALAAALGTDAGPTRRSPVLAGVAPLVALALLYLVLRLAMADHALAMTKRSLDAGDYGAATAEYETYWYWHLPGSSADMWYARSWMEVARKTPDLRVLEEAMAISEQAATRATETAEEPFAAWYNLAQICALHNDYNGTENSLRRAIDAHPNWFKPHWMLAQQLQLVSRLDEAATEAALAVDLDNGKHPEVARTLEDIRARRIGADSHAP
jgi:O-antigen ligase